MGETSWQRASGFFWWSFLYCHYDSSMCCVVLAFSFCITMIVAGMSIQFGVVFLGIKQMKGLGGRPEEACFARYWLLPSI